MLGAAAMSSLRASKIQAWLRTASSITSFPSGVPLRAHTVTGASVQPSEYMANRFYYTSQPIENTNLEALQFNLKMINAEKTLLFASDFPHWDFNLPSTIYDLPFLSEQAKRNILGETARQVYNLEV
jgi:predicted TIM-barrel fold metal-dependent hydrolase